MDTSSISMLIVDFFFEKINILNIVRFDSPSPVQYSWSTLQSNYTKARWSDPEIHLESIKISLRCFGNELRAHEIRQYSSINE
jgi:hypothetical protein